MKRILLISILLTSLTPVFAQWISQASGFTTASRGINYIHCVDGNTVWATGYDGSGGGVYITEYTKTTNGGTTWTPGSVLTQTGYGLGNITAVDGQNAWAAVYYNGTQNNTCGVYRTTDGGTTWTQQNVLQGSASFADNVYFWDANIGMCHGDVKDGYFEVYTTTDGGTTWTRRPTTDFSGVPVLSGEGGWTGVMETAGTSAVMFGTNKGNIYISNDKGITWVASYTGASASGTNGGINAIAFKDANNGLVGHSNETTGEYELYTTSNGGASWSALPHFGYCYNNDLAYVPGTPNTYISTGANTTIPAAGITYSYDGGLTWTEFNGTNGEQFLATGWVDNATGWAGDFNTDQTTGGMYKYNGVLTQLLHIDAEKGGCMVYPNPSNGQFTFAVVGEANETVTFEVFDMLGKVVYSSVENQPLVSFNKLVDLTSLPKGVYISKVTAGKQVYQDRIVIE